MLYGTITNENLTLEDCLFESADKPEVQTQIGVPEQLGILQLHANQGNPKAAQTIQILEVMKKLQVHTAAMKKEKQKLEGELAQLAERLKKEGTEPREADKQRLSLYINKLNQYQAQIPAVEKRIAELAAQAKQSWAEL